MVSPHIFLSASAVTLGLAAAPIAAPAIVTSTNIVTATDTVVNSNPITVYTATTVFEGNTDSHRSYVLGSCSRREHILSI